MSLLSAGLAFIASFVALSFLIPRLKTVKITGRDVHKPGQPQVPEMGGLGIAAGFAAGLLLAIGLETFFGSLLFVQLTLLLAVLGVVLIMTLIGVLDDLLGIGQVIKTILPVFAAFPLVAVKAGQTLITVPPFGRIDFGVFYALILVPLGVTGASNATNMLAGFNGLEAGLGLVAMGSLAVIAFTVKATTSFVILLAGIGALLAALYYNWYPARVLIGDAGTLTVGAIIASAVIVGNFEMAGVIVIIPYAIEFAFKAVNGFPSKNWWGELREDGKLYCPRSTLVSFPQLIMRITGGIHERNLTLVFMGIELVFGLIAIALYARV